METRKVQRVGYSTLTVSLPKTWVDQVGLKHGDVVTFVREEGDSSLKLFPRLQLEKEGILTAVINADFCNEEEMLTRILTGAYILGSDVMQVVSNTELHPEHLKEIHIRRLNDDYSYFTFDSRQENSKDIRPGKG